MMLYAETGTPRGPVITWKTDPEKLKQRMFREYARQYAVAFINGKISERRLLRVLRGTRKALEEVMPSAT